MTSSSSLCTFKFGFREDYQCPFPSRLKGFCIFHLTKLTKEEKDQLPEHVFTATQRIEEEFNVALTELLEKESVDPKKDYIDLRGFSFPAINWKGKEFLKRLNFHGANFQQEANFDDVVFYQDADFHSVSFVGSVSCSRTQFKAKAYFGGVTFHEFTSFSFAKFDGKATFLSEFRRMAYFHDACFKNKAEVS